MDKIKAVIAKIEADIKKADQWHSRAMGELSAASAECNKLRGDLAKLRTWEAIGLEYKLIRKKADVGNQTG